MTTNLCINCNLKGKYAKDRCETCYAYHRRTGRDRPSHLWKRSKICHNCEQQPAIARGRCHSCYQYHQKHGRERPSRLWQRQTNEPREPSNGKARLQAELIAAQSHPTARQLALVTQAMRNARKRIEFDQDAPIDLDQATTIHDMCVAIGIMPLSVLDEALNLIEPGKPKAPPLLELLDEDPRSMNELGRALQ